ncbi:MAG: pyridoxal-phosphate dependent enzyme [Saprospiraceae bacterium]
MKVYHNVLETIGNTPMIALNKVCSDIPAQVYAKVETFNPGHSIKDRMALKMIKDAEENRLLSPGGTIIECTSGNTGMGLAIIAAIKGYKCIFTTTDKQSSEKINMLKAFGAEVIVCPTNVESKDPKSYYSVAERLSKQLPNSFWCNQYDNLSNSQAHFESTGPEIWDQTDGKITHLVSGVGTGGTISGTGQYLKSMNPAIKIWGIDTYGSALKKYHETGILDQKEIYPYITEGIGEDIIPKNVDFSIIDLFEKVTDKDAALAARRLAKEEGLLLGYSAGSALAGLLQLKDKLTKDDVVVVIFHDHGSRYVGKIFNDDWMRERGFLETEIKVKDLIRNKEDKRFISLTAQNTVREALNLMKQYDISQLPVADGDQFTGSVSETHVLAYVLEDPIAHLENRIDTIMDDPLPHVPMEMGVRDVSRYFDRKIPAVMTQDPAGNWHVITQYDIIQSIRG